jgi:hypothetical protein
LCLRSAWRLRHAAHRRRGWMSKRCAATRRSSSDLAT